MIPADMRTMLTDYLFSFPGHHVYVVADGAALPGLSEAIAKNTPKHSGLYNDSINTEMAQVAPYLIQLDQSSPFFDWLLERWGQHLGIIAITPESVSFNDVKAHFQSLLMVKHPEGRAVYFRFYDPRVLRRFLPMCEAEQIPLLFNPIKLFVMEGAEPTSVARYWVEGHQIESKESRFEAA